MEAHYGLGQAYLEIGAYDDAKTAAEAALKLNPNSHKVRELIQVIAFARNIEKGKKIRRKILSYAVVIAIVAVAAFFVWRMLPPEPDPDPGPPQPAPPNLLIEPRLSERQLFAGRTADLTLMIKNSGGTARNVKIRLQPKSGGKVNYKLPASIPQVDKNGEETIEIPITADDNIAGTQKIELQIELLGENGMRLATTKLPITIFGPVPIK